MHSGRLSKGNTRFLGFTILLVGLRAVSRGQLKVQVAGLTEIGLVFWVTRPMTLSG